jgi:hypothetical protein
MNEREKIIAAIERLETEEYAVRTLECSLKQCRKQLRNAEADLCKVLHAVQGDKCREGVLFKGKRYQVAQSGYLVTSHIECEVLG